MHNLVIHAIDCKVHSAGVDQEVLEQLSDVVKAAADVGTASAPFLGPAGPAIAAALAAAGALIGPVVDLVAALDAASDAPDELYLNLSNYERIRQIWPRGGYSEVRSGQIVRPNLTVPFSGAVDVNFWEHDHGSDDDFLGRLTVDVSHTGGIRYQVVARPSEGAVYVVVYSVEQVVDPVVPAAGSLVWYRHNSWLDGAAGWAGPLEVSTNWHSFKSVFATSDGVVYGIKPDGKLLWHRQLSYQNDRPGNFTNPVQVGTDWHGFKFVFATSGGGIYGVKSDGKLLCYRHKGYLGSSGPPSQIGVGVQVGTDWHGFKSAFATSNGVLYGIKPDGKLIQYQHANYLAISGPPSQVGAGVQVGTDWHGFKSVFATTNGVIYGLKPDGKLLWYYHQGWQTGTSNWVGHRQVGTGWQSFKSVFATSNGIIYGINPHP